MAARGFVWTCVQTILIGVGLALSANAAAAASCVQSANATTWSNTSIATQTATFTAAFDVTPGQSDIDGVAGFSLGAASGYTSLAALVRFNQSGTIDVRNGANYTADSTIAYAAGSTYHVQMVINPAAHTYTVYVTPPGGSQTTIATNYAFRGEQASTSSLNNWALLSDVGTESVCNMTVASAPVITTQPSNATVASGASATFSVTAIGNAPLTYQWKQNGTAISGATSASYKTPATTSSNNGAQFTVVVSNSSGSATSNAATLTVTSAASCVQSANATTWSNTSIATQTATFTAAFDVTPGQSDIDGVAGFSLGAASGYTSLAALVRFNQSGTIDVRNGANYTADSTIAYAAGSTYHLQMVINPAAHTYTVYVTPPGGSQTTIATNYAFRSEQASTSSLNNWALLSDVGTESVCNMTISSSSGSAPVSSPAISVQPTSMNFGNVNVGGNSTLTGTISSTGTAALSITAVTISGSGYKMSLQPVSVSAGSSASFTVTFTPTTAGSAAGTISITSNAAASPTTIALTGTGVQAEISASPSSVSFGTVADGTTDTLPITLKNGGNATLTFTQIAVSGTGFAQTGLSTSTTLAAGASTTFNATFDPSSAGAATGSIILTTNGAPSPLAISLSGTGQSSSYLLGASPASLSFGSQPDQTSQSQTATLTNNGNSNVVISGVTVKGAGFSASGVSSGTTLQPGQSVTLTVAFDPSSGGAVSGASVSIASNASNSPAVIALSGTGTHWVQLSWSPSSTSGVTYNVYRGTSSGAESSTPLNPSSISGTSYSDSQVTPGQTYYYTVKAVDSGGASAPSNEASAAIPNP